MTTKENPLKSDMSEKIQTNISLLDSHLDRQIEAHSATKNSISILIAAITLLMSILPNRVCSDLIFLFHIFAAGLIIYSITLLTITLEVWPSIQAYFGNKKDLNSDEYIEWIQELLINAAKKNTWILENLNQKYYILRILVVLLVMIFILLTFINYVR